MATSGKLMEDLHQEIECSICLERFKNPKILPCLHTFCEKCLQQHVDNKVEGGLVPCPMCKVKATVPEEGAAGFNHNFYIAHLCDIIPEGCDASCDVCRMRGSEVSAVAMCVECAGHLCQPCSDTHLGTKYTYDHRVVKLSDVLSGQYFDEMRSCQKVCCPTHPDKVLEIYCEECKVPICLLCKALKHNIHQVASLTDAAKRVDDDVQILITKLHDVGKVSEELSERSKHIFDNIDVDHTDLKKELKCVFNQFRDDIKHAIDEKEHTAFDQLNAQVTCAKKQAEIAFNETELNRLKVTGTLNYAESMMKNGKDAERLQQHEDVIKRLKTLNSQGIMMDIVKPIFRLQPAKLNIPDLTINVVTELEKCQITSQLPNQICGRAPKILDRAIMVDSFSSRLEDDEEEEDEEEGEEEGDIEEVREEERVDQEDDEGEDEENPKYWGMAVFNNRVITTDSFNKQVKVFKRDGQLDRLVDQSEHQLQYPCVVTCNDVDDIFVIDCGIRGVVKYNKEGVMKKVMKDMYESKGFAGITCKNNQVVITKYYGGRVIITDLNLVVKKVIDKTSLGLSEFRPTYVAVDNNDHLVVSDWAAACVYIIDYNKSVIIHKYQPTGVLSMRGPLGVCVDAFGNMLVADSCNHRVHVISSTGDHVGVPITDQDVEYPSALAMSGPGEVAVLEHGGVVKMFKYMDM